MLGLERERIMLHGISFKRYPCTNFSTCSQSEPHPRETHHEEDRENKRIVGRRQLEILLHPPDFRILHDTISSQLHPRGPTHPDIGPI